MSGLLRRIRRPGAAEETRTEPTTALPDPARGSAPEAPATGEDGQRLPAGVAPEDARAPRRDHPAPRGCAAARASCAGRASCAARPRRPRLRGPPARAGRRQGWSRTRLAAPGRARRRAPRARGRARHAARRDRDPRARRRRHLRPLRRAARQRRASFCARCGANLAEAAREAAAAEAERRRIAAERAEAARKAEAEKADAARKADAEDGEAGKPAATPQALPTRQARQTRPARSGRKPTSPPTTPQRQRRAPTPAPRSPRRKPPTRRRRAATTARGRRARDPRDRPHDRRRHSSARDRAASCPRCGAALAPDQEWCLSCGAAVGTRDRPHAALAACRWPRRRRARALRGGDRALAGRARRRPAAGRQGAGDQPPAATPTVPARRGRHRGRAAHGAAAVGHAHRRPRPSPRAMAPRAPTRARSRRPATAPNAGGTASWPTGKTAWTVILASTPSRADAQKKADGRRARRRRAPLGRLLVAAQGLLGRVRRASTRARRPPQAAAQGRGGDAYARRVVPALGPLRGAHRRPPRREPLGGRERQPVHRHRIRPPAPRR